MTISGINGVLKEIGEERRRQLRQEGFSRDHDDGHECGELAKAGASYALASTQNQAAAAAAIWPWDDAYKGNQHGRRRLLVIAAAFLVAEIERVDRLATENRR